MHVLQPCLYVGAWLGQAWPAVGQEPRKQRSAWVGGCLPFESPLKSTCWCHLLRCHLVDVKLTSWLPAVLKGLEFEASLVLLSPVIAVLQLSSLDKFWFRKHPRQSFLLQMHKTKLVFVQWGFAALPCCGVFPQMHLHSDTKDHNAWSPSNSNTLLLQTSSWG